MTWQTILYFISILMAFAVIGFLAFYAWRQQRIRYYRTQAEIAEALRNSEARYRTLAETSPDMIFVIDRQDKVQYVNNLASRQFGKTPEQVIGKARTELFPPTIAENQALGLQQVLKSGEPFSSESQIIFPEGQLWLDTQLVPLRNEAGEVSAVMGVSRDITERKQAAEALRENEERYRSLYENSTIGIYRTTPDGRILLANASLVNMLGYSSFEELSARDLTKDGYEPSYPRARFLERMEKEGEVRGLESVWQRQDGSSLFVSESARAIRDPLGEVLFFDGTVEDITERKQAEMQVRLQSSALNAAANAIVITDRDGRIQWINPAWTELTGYVLEEVLGQNPRLLKSGIQDSAFYKNMWDTILAGKVWHNELVNKRKDGSLYNEEETITPLLDEQGQITHFIGIKQDITERKLSEQALQQSEKKFKDLVENAMVGVYMTNVKGDVLYVNDAALKIFGFDSAEELISSGAVVRYKDPKDRAILLENLKHKGSIRDFEFKALIKTGETRDILLSAVLAGDVLTGMLLDITERKRAEQALQEYNTRLETDVTERTRELRQAQEQIVRQERLATLGQLAGSIGHELRNPLGVISNAIYYLKMAQPDADDTVKEYLEIIENEMRVSDKIVTDLLDFTRLKSVDRASVIVSELVRQTLERFPAPASVEVVLEIAADLPPVYADPHHIVQVLGNLTVNACQAMNNVGKLIISAAAQGDMIRIAVRDTGMGISPEVMRKLFEPLFTTKIKGIGLGLAVSKKLVEANGGRIEVQSEPGKGSTFSVYLPVYEVVPAPAYHPESLTGRDQEEK